jgi:protein ImuA
MKLVSELRERVRRIERSPAMAHGVLPFGVAAIDRALPGGGLARGALHEILGAGGDEEDGALAAAFAASILGRLTKPPTSPSRSLTRPGPSLSPLKGGEGKQTFPLSAPGGGEGRGEVGVVLWCLPRPDIYGPGLAAHGLDPGRVVLVRALRDAEILWAMEEGLRAPGIVAVVGEVGSLPMVASRRLQLAAERSGITAFLLRRWREGGQAARERALPNAAVTRWRIAALPSRPMRDEPGVGHSWWRIELLRCRGGELGCWEMEVPDATDHVSLAAALADRPAAAVAAEKYRRAG